MHFLCTAYGDSQGRRRGRKRALWNTNVEYVTARNKMPLLALERGKERKCREPSTTASLATGLVGSSRWLGQRPPD